MRTLSLKGQGWLGKFIVVAEEQGRCMRSRWAANRR